MATLFASAPMILGGITAAKSLKPSAPKPPSPIPMPDVEALQAQQRRTSAGMRRSGRASTILTDTGGTLG